MESSYNKTVTVYKNYYVSTFVLAVWIIMVMFLVHLVESRVSELESRKPIVNTIHTVVHDSTYVTDTLVIARDPLSPLSFCGITQDARGRCLDTEGDVVLP